MNTHTRPDGRLAHQLRPLRITTGVQKSPDGSVLIEVGDTRVLCAVTVEERVPPFLIGKGQGWLTAEYAMLPGATNTRNARESSKGKVSGRTHEIQRLIGRSLRATLDLNALGPRTLWIDCDVLQADGGTRTASITGAFVAVALALHRIHQRAPFAVPPLRTSVAAVSVGILEDEPRLDLCYAEDSACDVDMNIVMTGLGHFVEVQGTAEGAPFSEAHLAALLQLARQGIHTLAAAQLQALAGLDLDGIWAAHP